MYLFFSRKGAKAQRKSKKKSFSSVSTFFVMVVSCGMIHRLFEQPAVSGFRFCGRKSVVVSKLSVAACKNSKLTGGWLPGWNESIVPGLAENKKAILSDSFFYVVQWNAYLTP
ncbi:MAG: hypothetical protein AB7U05_14255 [Mangrovibacterium sp.]